MNRPYWRGIPVDRLPESVIQGECTRLGYAIDAERARIAACKAVELAPRDTGADRGEPKDGEGVSVRELFHGARNIVHNVLATPFYALRCALGWHRWTHVRRLSFQNSGAIPTRWRSYDVCAHCRRINPASETSEPWRPGDADGE